MKFNGFPFYITGNTANCNLVEFMEFFFFNQIRLDTDSASSDALWPLNNIYKDHENFILHTFEMLFDLKYLFGNFQKIAEIISDELKSIDVARSYKGYDLCSVFIDIKNSILKGKVPDKDSVDILTKAVTPEAKEWPLNIYCLFKFFGIEEKPIHEYFKTINSFKGQDDLKRCFHHIGTYGIRMIVYCIILKNEFDVETYRRLRIYSTSFEIMINLLNDLPSNEERDNSGKFILALMRAAYLHGAMDREDEFYSDESFRTMDSVGTSFTSLQKHELKNFYYAIAIEEATKPWEDGSNLFHNEMAKYLCEKDTFKILKEKRLRNELRPIAGKYGLIWGPKRRSRKKKID